MGARERWWHRDVSRATRLETLSILAEFNRDGTPNAANAAAIDKCAARWHAAGREVLVVEPTVGGDLNDALVRGAPDEPREQSHGDHLSGSAGSAASAPGLP